MNENIWKIINKLLGWGAIGAIFALTIFMANIEIKDLDLWLHLAMGKFIVTNGYVPQTDVLSCTISGRPWINHEWLFQVIVYQIFSAWGIDGLTTMQVWLVTATMGILLFLGYNREKQWIVLLPLLFVAFIFQERFTYRPDLFSLLFFSVYLWMLSKYQNKRWLPIFLFLVQVFWVNIHGFFILGPILVLVWVIGEQFTLYAQKKAGTLTQRGMTELNRVLVCVLLACLINPMGIKGALYPLHVFGSAFNDSRIFFEHIGELETTLSWNNFFVSSEYLGLKLLMVLSAILLILNYRQLNFRDVFLWCLFLFISLSARRNVVFFSFIAYWIIVRYTERLADVFKSYLWDFSRVLKIGARCVLKICIIAFVIIQWQKISLNGYFDFDRYERKSEYGGISMRNFPFKAVDFLVKNDIKGNFYNDFNSGAYLLGRCFPNIRVSIDGRTELYGAPFFKEHDDIWRGNDGLFNAWVKKYNFTGVMLGSVYGPTPQSILLNLSLNKEWALVYFDFDGVIFLKKDVESNKPIIDKYAVAIDQWRAPKLDIDRIGLRKVEPYQHVNRAFSLASMRKYDQALEEGFEALRVWPSEGGAYKIVGYCFLKKALWDDAFQTLRIAKLLNPSDREVRYYLATVYEGKKEYDKAIEQAHIVLETPSGQSLGLLLLSRIYAKTDKFEQSLRSLQTLDKLNKIIPSHADDILEIGDMIYARGQYRYAVEVYKLGLKTHNEQEKFYYKIGLSLDQLGEGAAAKENFMNVLKAGQKP